MYILTKDIRNEFIAGLRPSYAKSLPRMSLAGGHGIMFAAKELYLSGTPFQNRGVGRQRRMNDPVALESVLHPLCEKILRYFFVDPTPSSQAAFDKFHDELCVMFLDGFREAGYTHTYGNAQKFINILFKYLSCFEDAELYFEEKFKYCHMAIDRYTYNGYRLPFYRNVVYPSIYGHSPKELTAWSQLTKTEYLNLKNDIVKYISGAPKTYNEYLRICHLLSVFTRVPFLTDDYVMTPFEAEFFLWTIAKCCQEKNENDTYVYNATFVREIQKML
jgi:hypothetical protein